MTPPYQSMWPARLSTIATIPYRLLKMILYIPAVIWVFRSEIFGRDGYLRWLVWLFIGAAIHLCAIQLSWLVCLNVDLTLLNPLTYSGYGRVITIGWYCGWIWLWVNE